MGDTDGTVTVAGKQYPFNINSMRDHSYGMLSAVKRKTLRASILV